MKHALQILLMIVLATSHPATLQAQISTQQSLLANPSLPILFTGLDNRINIGPLPAGAIASFIKSSLRKAGTGYLVQVPSTASGTDTLYIRKGRRTLSARPFILQHLGKGEIRLGARNVMGHLVTITRQELLKARALEFVFSAPARQDLVRIISFEVTCVHTGYYECTQVSGAAFTRLVEAMFRGLHRGDRVYLDQIRAAMPDGVIRHLGTVTLLVQ